MKREDREIYKLADILAEIIADGKTDSAKSAVRELLIKFAEEIQRMTIEGD